MKSKQIIIWATGIDALLKGEGMVGGLTVQMMHWSKAFIENGWHVSSLTSQERNNTIVEDINFKYLKKIRFINILLEPLFVFLFLLQHKPSLVITRGASRSLFGLAVSTKILHIKLILMLASDTDAKKGQELIAKPWDRWLYRQGLRRCKYVVVQNTDQKALVNKHYSKAKTITIPNIWPAASADIDSNLENEKKIILWVGNFRALKRPKWFLELAKQLPEYRFVMVGKAIDKNLYEECRKNAEALPNVSFMGALSFSETDKLFKQCKVFLCTSDIEGFPNTFLQSWANGVPVVTSFDPSNVVKNKNLGVVICNVEDAEKALFSLLLDEVFYKSKQASVNPYFEGAHAPQSQYQKLIEMVN